MSNPTTLFPGYAFILNLTGSGAQMKPLGGFSDCAGLPVKVRGLNNVGDVTLKRGVVDSSGLSEWLSAARNNAATAGREAIITQRNGGAVPVQSWKLSSALPIKYSGPTLGDKGNDVSVEELILSSAGIEIIPPG